MNLRILHWVCLLAIFIPFVCDAAPAAKGPSLEDYGALPAVDHMAISPDAQLIAFRKNSNDKEIIVVVSIATGEVLSALDVSHTRLRNIYFFDESRVICVTSDHRRVWGYRDSFDVSSAFLLHVKTGKIEQLLTPGDVIYKGQSGLGRIVGVSKDGNYAFMPAFVPESKRDQSPDYSLVRVDLNSPRRPRVIERGKNYSTDYFLDGEGNLVGEERYNSRGRLYSIIAYDGDNEKTLFSQEVDIPEIGVVGITPDKKSLVINDHDSEERRGALRSISLKDGKVSDPIFVRSDADVEATLTDINRTVFGVMYSGLKPTYEFYDRALTQRMNDIVEAHPQHSVWLEDWSADWKHLLVKVEGQTTSGSYFLYSEGAKPKFLASARPNIVGDFVNPVVEFTYKARDGLKIPALVTIPKKRVESLQHLPAVILPHGGPSSHDWLGFDWLAQALANRGYLVMQPQFRGSTGFGLDHWLAGEGQWGRGMQDDLSDGVQALVKQKLIDPKKVCIVGASYGGYAALAGAAYSPEIYRCAVSINGVADLRAMIASEKRAHGRDHYITRYWKTLISGSDADDKVLQRLSPSENAESIVAPILLLHGEDDEVVEFEQAKIMRKSLKKAKKSVKLVKLKGEDHFLSKSATRLQTLKELVSFLDHQLEMK